MNKHVPKCVQNHQKKEFVMGPIEVCGTEATLSVYNYGLNSTYYRVNFMPVPDSMATFMVGDFEGKCKFSTFIDEDTILLQISQRFLVFTPSAVFIDEVNFRELSEDKPIEDKLSNENKKEKKLTLKQIEKIN